MHRALFKIVFALFLITITVTANSSNQMTEARQIAEGAHEKEGTLVGAAGTAERMSKDTKDGQSFVDKWYQASDNYQDYSFDYEMTVFKNSGPVVQKGHLAFKRPRLLRIEVTSGPNNGAVAVLEPSGKVKAHMGGGMSLFVVNLSPHSDLLRSPNGWPMVDSDFTSLACAIQQYLKEGCVSRISNTPDVTSSTGTKSFELTVLKDSADGELYKRALFDPQTAMPIEWWDYKDGKVYAHSLWTNFKPNCNLSEKTFTIKGDK